MIRSFAAVWLAGLCRLAAAWGSGAGELPDAVGPVALGLDPQPGMWMEYRLTLPFDPLEDELRAAAIREAERQAALALELAAAAPAESEARAKAAATAPPDAAAPAARAKPPARKPAAAAPSSSPPVLTPPFGLTARKEPFPVRVTIRSVTPLTVELALRTPGQREERVVTVPRVNPLSGAILEATERLARMETDENATEDNSPMPRPVVPAVPGTGAAVAANDDAARPDAVGSAALELSGNQTLAATTHRYGSGPTAVEVWIHPAVPFGVAAVRTRDLELFLRGHGAGEAPSFPLP